MKNLIFIAALILSFNMYGQKNLDSNNVFVRVYNMQREKIAKGKILLITEESLQLFIDEETTIIPVTDIGTIRTKHSGGYNVLLGAVIGAVGGSIFAVQETSGKMIGAEGAVLAGGVLGSATGILIGGITIPFKKPTSYDIYGDTLKLKAFKDELIGKQ